MLACVRCLRSLFAIDRLRRPAFTYDANGNMVSGDGRAVTYSAFDKPTQITQGANTVAIAYGPDRGRFSRTDTTSSGTTTTVYVGGRVFEEVTLPSGTIERKHYIGDFAVVTGIAGTQYLFSCATASAPAPELIATPPHRDEPARPH